MTATPPPPAGNLHLLVAWPYGSTIEARLVKTSGQVDASLRRGAEEAVSQLTNGAVYKPDADMEDNTHMEASRAEVDGSGLLAELNRGGSLDLATGQELRDKPLRCHAVLFEDADSRMLFIRKRTPVQFATKSLVATLLNGTLDRIESPVLAFDTRYDVIVAEDRVYVLDKNAFEALFNEPSVVAEEAKRHVAQLSSRVRMSPGSPETLEKVVATNVFLRRKLNAIARSDYLATVSPQQLRVEIARCSLEVQDLMDGDSLNITLENAKDVLRLLNEDLFRGGFSDTRFAASSKRSLT